MTMKREIEFRGFIRNNNYEKKVVVNGEVFRGYWCYWNEFGVVVAEENCKDIYLNEHRCYYGIVEKNRVIPETVGQYVGIKDKNGKKIFEHDIVKHLYGNHEVVFGEYGDEPHTTIGFFTKENQALFIGEEDDFWYDGINSRQEIEVLGNVFDNPELLNKIEYKGESDNGD